MIRTRRSAALAAIVLGLLPAPAWSEGALAVGSTGNVTKDGIAFGTAVNYGSSNAARSAAMEKCSGYQSAPKAAAQCRLVGTFRRECWAIAMDPKPGTPGAGWAVASDKSTAERRALDACRATAGAGRTEFCEADSADCDEND
jgi:hypothetical protein